MSKNSANPKAKFFPVKGATHFSILAPVNKVIARKIDIAEATVKVHIKAILRKIRVQNRTQAAIWAMNHNSALLAVSNGSAASGEMRPQIAPPASRANGR